MRELPTADDDIWTRQSNVFRNPEPQSAWQRYNCRVDFNSGYLRHPVQQFLRNLGQGLDAKLRPDGERYAHATVPILERRLCSLATDLDGFFDVTGELGLGVFRCATKEGRNHTKSGGLDSPSPQPVGPAPRGAGNGWNVRSEASGTKYTK